MLCVFNRQRAVCMFSAISMQQFWWRPNGIPSGRFGILGHFKNALHNSFHPYEWELSATFSVTSPLNHFSPPKWKIGTISRKSLLHRHCFWKSAVNSKIFFRENFTNIKHQRWSFGRVPTRFGAHLFPLSLSYLHGKSSLVVWLRKEEEEEKTSIFLRSIKTLMDFYAQSFFESRREAFAGGWNKGKVLVQRSRKRVLTHVSRTSFRKISLSSRTFWSGCWGAWKIRPSSSFVILWTLSIAFRVWKSRSMQWIRRSFHPGWTASTC